MTRPPSLTGAEIIAALSKVGFKVIRIKGSHHVLRHARRTTSLPAPFPAGTAPRGAGNATASPDFSPLPANSYVPHACSSNSDAAVSDDHEMSSQVGL